LSRYLPVKNEEIIKHVAKQDMNKPSIVSSISFSLKNIGRKGANYQYVIAAKPVITNTTITFNGVFSSFSYSSFYICLS